jgi:hypothetical protein
MSSASLKRLAKLEEALNQLTAKKKAYLVVHRGNDLEAEIQWHIDAGLYDPDTQEAVIIMAWGPRPRPDPKTYREQGEWNSSDLPQIRKPRESDLIIEEVNALPRLDSPADPVPEPRPEPRRRIKYPDMGIV